MEEINANNATHVIYKSYEYSNFKFVDYNRNICEKNLTKLIDLNKERNRFHLFPIVVDMSLNIIDGQHRYEASKQLNSPIHYVIDNCDEGHWDQITKVNIAGKKHDITDIFNMLLKDNDPTCIELKLMLEDFPWMPLGNFIRYFLGSGEHMGKRTILDLMRCKQHKLLNKEHKLICLKGFVETFKYFKVGHVQSFKLLWQNSNVSNPYELAQNLKAKGFIPVKSWSVSTFKEDLIRHYNKSKRAKNKISI